MLIVDSRDSHSAKARRMDIKPDMWVIRSAIGMRSDEGNVYSGFSCSDRYTDIL